MLLTVGVLAALLERSTSGQGQVIDAAMLDGSALLMTSILGWMNRGSWAGAPGTNVIDSGSPFYQVYETLDGRHMAFGSVEPKFYRELVSVLELDAASLPAQFDRPRWPEMKKLFAQAVAGRTMSDWIDAFEGHEACASPVFDMAEAFAHPHNVERGTYVEVDGVIQPAPAPRFDRTPSQIVKGGKNETVDGVLHRWSYL